MPSSSTAPDWLEVAAWTNHQWEGGGHELREGKKESEEQRENEEEKVGEEFGSRKRKGRA